MYERYTPRLLIAQAVALETPQIMIDEGFVPEIYLDTVNKPTFGWGTLVTRDMPEHGMRVGTPVDFRRCWSCLQHELFTVQEDFAAVFSDDEAINMDGDVMQVMLNMLYNLGRPRFCGFENTIKAVKAKDYGIASREILDSRAGRALVIRYTRLSNRVGACYA